MQQLAAGDQVFPGVRGYYWLDWPSDLPRPLTAAWIGLTWLQW